MTDNIQKLYEIAGVKKKYCGWLDMGDLDTQYEYVMCDTLKEYKETAEFSRTSYSSDNENYMIPEIKYPSFTAEKQLELIKWVSDIFVFRTYARLKKETTCFLTEREYGCDEYFCKSSTLDQALAGLIINLWQDLTDNQKQEIKKKSMVPFFEMYYAIIYW